MELKFGLYYVTRLAYKVEQFVHMIQIQ